MISSCIKCGSDFCPTASQIQKSHWVCKQCRSSDDAARRQRRKAAGLSISGRAMPREWHRAYEKEYYQRPEVKRLRAKKAKERTRDPAQRHKHEARWKARSAIASGKLKRQPCEVCAAPKVDAHHDDYSKPLDVRWLCRAHHVEWHKQHKARGETS